MARAAKPKIRPGRYRTAEGCEVIITHVTNLRAYGRLLELRDTTWWYAQSGEHGLYPSDDLIEQLTETPPS